MFTVEKKSILRKFQAQRIAKRGPIGTAVLLSLAFTIASGVVYPPGRTVQAAGETTAKTSSGTVVVGDTENGANLENTANATNPTFRLGGSETILGPSWRIDTPFHTLGTLSTSGSTPNVIGYMGNSKSWAYSTSDLRTLSVLPNLALDKGPDGKFDGCPGGGAWLTSTWRDPADPSFVRGWYHAETEQQCDAAASTRKSVGYAESRDGGKTFTKPNYPYNQVITAPSQYTDGLAGSEGDQHVIRVGDYFYMYFVAARDSHKIHLARSRVSDGGRPGTWYKWYNGAFTQPGLGGESTALASGSVLGRAWVSYNSYLREYMGFSWSPSGFGISLSPDGLSWRRVSGDLLYTEHQFHNRTSTSGVLIEYPSLIGLDGNSDIQGGQMWLYYMKVEAGASMTGDTRYLIRKPFSIDAASSTGSTTANSYRFTPSADATVSEAKPGTNFGSSGSLLVNGGSSSRLKSYLRFTVSGVSGTVQSAKLRVYAYNGTVDGPAVYGNSSSWSETGITWANAPQATTGRIADRDAVATNSWVEYDVKSLISSGGTGTYSLHFYTAATDGADFYSRESTRKPELVLTTSTSTGASNNATADADRDIDTGIVHSGSVPASAPGTLAMDPLWRPAGMQ